MIQNILAYLSVVACALAAQFTEIDPYDQMQYYIADLPQIQIQTTQNDQNLVQIPLEEYEEFDIWQVTVDKVLNEYEYCQPAYSGYEVQLSDDPVELFSISDTADQLERTDFNYLTSITYQGNYAYTVDSQFRLYSFLIIQDEFDKEQLHLKPTETMDYKDLAPNNTDIFFSPLLADTTQDSGEATRPIIIVFPDRAIIVDFKLVKRYFASGWIKQNTTLKASIVSGNLYVLTDVSILVYSINNDFSDISLIFQINQTTLQPIGLVAQFTDFEVSQFSSYIYVLNELTGIIRFDLATFKLDKEFILPLIGGLKFNNYKETSFMVAIKLGNIHMAIEIIVDQKEKTYYIQQAPIVSNSAIRKIIMDEDIGFLVGNSVEKPIVHSILYRLKSPQEKKKENQDFVVIERTNDILLYNNIVVSKNISEKIWEQPIFAIGVGRNSPKAITLQRRKKMIQCYFPNQLFNDAYYQLNVNLRTRTCKESLEQNPASACLLKLPIEIKFEKVYLQEDDLNTVGLAIGLSILVLIIIGIIVFIWYKQSKSREQNYMGLIDRYARGGDLVMMSPMASNKENPEANEIQNSEN